MTRVKVVVEGPTEEAFVRSVLAEALWPSGVSLTPIVLGVPGHKGGAANYARVKKDLLLHLKQDRTAYCSTMLDFYGLGEGFPGMPLPPGLPNIAKVTRIEEAIKAEICKLIPDFRPDVRLLPYLQLHEYEGLLFSDPPAFARALAQPQLAQTFQDVRDGFPTPEDINDNPATAPSKCVLRVFRSYNKVLHGTIAARGVSIDAMRRECPHFRGWLAQLEALRQNPPLQ
ncbi:MAG TPA: DUF4276 family protein [Bryobacteraceae bacterium]|nr:DUF4276 family protein [Bryobacteraceae bacterium]